MKNTYDTCRYQINSFISLWVVAGWTSFFPGNLVHLSHLETRAQLISACVWAKSTPAVLTGFSISASGCCEQKSTLWLDTFFETRYFLLRTKHYLENNVKTSMVCFVIVVVIFCDLLHQYTRVPELPVVLQCYRGLLSILFPQATGISIPPESLLPLWCIGP